MAILGFNFDLMDQLAFYGSYHRNKWNQLIHFFFVPLILWSFAVWFATIGGYRCQPSWLLQLPLPDSLLRCSEVNGALVLVTVYGLYYVSLEAVAGATWLMIIGIPMFISATWFWQNVSHAAWWALAAQLLAWYMQLHPGHGLLEKRKPALADSFAQSLVLAPLFVWMEALFLFGYRRSLHQELLDRIQINCSKNKHG